MSEPASYAVEIPGLAESISGAVPPTTAKDKHSSLIASIRCHHSLANAKLVTHRGGFWKSRRKVLTAVGDLVHEDHEAWLMIECERDGGDVRATWRRLQPLGHQLTECALTQHYVVADRGGVRADDFVQLEIGLEEEYVDRRLFESRRTYGPDDMADLVSLAEDGPRTDSDHRRPYGRPTYRLGKAVDVALFVDEAQQVDAESRTVRNLRLLKVTMDGQAPRTLTVGELQREMDIDVDHRWKGRRLFDDWAVSSAGRSGGRFCDHWALDLTDWTDPRSGDRTLSLIPLWSYLRPLAEIDRPGLSPYALFAKLETLDRRVKVPFGWYFYMLHGNRVHDWAGHRVIKAAEAGVIVLPEHDYRVLKAWEAQPYGF